MARGLPKERLPARYSTVHYHMTFIIVTLTDTTPYLLRDEDGEEFYDMTISHSLRRAKEKKLLNGLCFYSTQNVVPSFDSLQRIVESAGGEVRT